jgi:CTP:phosphocholine cytidylyltransferase-like protein
MELTDGRCFETRNRIITRLKLGGRNCHHLFGISYWNKQDGAKMADHIGQVYEMPGGRECYWDQVALEYFIKDYRIEVRECSFADMVKVDTLSALKKLDEAYRR